MFSIIKGFFGGVWSYVGVALAAVAGVVAIFMRGSDYGRKKSELDARDALDDAEAETARVHLTEQEKINAIHKQDHASTDPDNLN